MAGAFTSRQTNATLFPGLLAERGFVPVRREHGYGLPTDPARTGLAGRDVPAGLTVISPDAADVDRLQQLDEELRADVPGWHEDPAEFGRDTFSDDAFDPATYLLAVDDRTGGYVGMVRVWLNLSGPRLGLIGALRPYRRSRRGHLTGDTSYNNMKF